MQKTLCDCSKEETMKFYSLYNAYQAADKLNDRAEAAWKFLLYVYPLLGYNVLSYFVKQMFDEAQHNTIVALVMRECGSGCITFYPPK